MARRIFSEETDLEIARCYLAGERGNSLAKRYEVTLMTIYNALDRCGVARQRRWYSLNKDAFKDAENDPVKSYFVGLLMADGCVHERDGYSYVALMLSGEEDAFLVETFRTFLDTDQPTLKRKACWADVPGGISWRQQTTRLSVCSKTLVQDLARYGVLPRKSLTAAPVKFMTDGPHAAHFFRGLVDGDGWVSITRHKRFSFKPKASIGLVGSYETVSAFGAFAQRFFSCDRKPVQHNTIWRQTFTNNQGARLARALYEDCPVALPRKLRAAQQIMKECSEVHEGARFFTYQGETLSISEWGRRTGLGVAVVWYRLNHGWPIEDALTRPLFR